MGHTLKGKKVAILVTDGFEQIELTSPQRALQDAGAQTCIIAPAEAKRVQGWKDSDWGDSFAVDVSLTGARAEDYDALLLPGGVLNADKLKIEPAAIQFAREFFNQGKPVAAICHGPWILVDAEVLQGRALTSFPALKKDLQNAGAEWFDREVIVDNGLVTSRKPADLAAFNEKMIAEFAEDVHGEPLAQFI
jgi:protease I